MAEYLLVTRELLAGLYADMESAAPEPPSLKSDEGAAFDKEVTFDASQIKPMITYGTNPGMGIPIDGAIPELSAIDEAGKISFEKSLKYMGFEPGQKLEGKDSLIINNFIRVFNFCTEGSSKGRTTGSGPVNRGSSPCPSAISFMMDQNRFSSLAVFFYFIQNMVSSLHYH